MRRAEIKQGANEVLAALDKSGLGQALQQRERGREGLDPNLLQKFKVYSIQASRFSDPARQMAIILELHALEDPETWVAVSEPDGPARWHLVRSITFAMETLPKFLHLLDQKGVENYVNVVEKGRLPNEAYQVLSVIVLEEDDQFSRPQRLIEVLEGSSMLYEACAILLGESPDRLTVLSCDSGSDKSFDLLGAAKVVEQVKEVILGLWDKVVFYKEKKFAAQADATLQGLAVFARLNEMESTGQMGREQAELVRRGLMNGCQKFLNAGAIIPEIRDHSHHNPRVLMAPEQKLLMAPASAEVPSGDSSSSPNGPTDVKAHSGLSNEEVLERMKKLEALLAQQAERGSEAPKRPGRRREKRSSESTPE